MSEFSVLQVRGRGGERSVVAGGVLHTPLDQRCSISLQSAWSPIVQMPNDHHPLSTNPSDDALAMEAAANFCTNFLRAWVGEDREKEQGEGGIANPSLRAFRCP